MDEFPATTLKFNKVAHRYWLDRKPIPGVSGVLDRGYAMGGLDRWAAEQIADFVDREWDSLQESSPEARYWRVRKAADAVKRERGARGTALHKLIEDELQGIPGEIPAHLRSPFYGWLEWWHSSGLRALEVERQCANRATWVAGTFDCLAEDQGNQLWLLDWKSSNKVRIRHGIQLQAYSEMEFYVNSEGLEVPMPSDVQLGVVHIGEEETICEVIPEDKRWVYERLWLTVREKVTWDKHLKDAFPGDDFQFPTSQGNTSIGKDADNVRV